MQSSWSRYLEYACLAVLSLTLALAPVYAGKLFVWQDMLFAALVFLALLLAACGARRFARAMPATYAWLLLGVLLLAIAAAATGVYKHGSLLALGQLAAYLGAFALCSSLAGNKRFATALTWSLLAGAVIAAAWGLREYMYTVMRGGDVSWRIFGPFNNPNSLAGYLVVLLPLSLALLWRGLRENRGEGPRWEAIGGLFGTLLMGLALLLTGSKAGILAALIGLMVFAVIAPRPSSRASRIARRAAAIGVLVVVLLAVLLPPIRARITTAFSTQSHSAAFRWYTWLGTIDMLKARPLLGFGPGTFQYAYPRYARAGFTQMAHESYLQWAAEMGIPAALLLLATLLLIARTIWRRLRVSDATARLIPAAALAGLCGFALHNLVDYPWYVSATGATMWALLGIAIAQGEDVPHPRPFGPYWRAWLAGLAAAILLLAALGLRAQSIAAGADAITGRGLYAAAANRYRQALAWDRLDADLWVKLSHIQEAMGRGGDKTQLVAAVNSRLRVAQLRPTQPENYRRLGRLYEHFGDLPSAVSATQKAIEYQPLYPKALAQLGRLYEKLGQDDLAAEAYQRLVAIYDSPYRTAHALEILGEYSYVEGWIFLGKQKLAEGDGQAAQVILSLAARELARQLNELETHRELLEEMGAWDPEVQSRARNRATEVLALLEGTDDPLTRLRMAALWAVLKRPDKARQLAQDNPLLQPDSPRPPEWEEEDAQIVRKLREILAGGEADSSG